MGNRYRLTPRFFFLVPFYPGKIGAQFHSIQQILEPSSILSRKGNPVPFYPAKCCEKWSPVLFSPAKLGKRNPVSAKCWEKGNPVPFCPAKCWEIWNRECLSMIVLYSNLHRYLKYTLDKIVEQDYTLLYCHYGFSSHNKPRFSWIKQVYREMDRK